MKEYEFGGKVYILKDVSKSVGKNPCECCSLNHNEGICFDTASGLCGTYGYFVEKSKETDTTPPTTSLPEVGITDGFDMTQCKVGDWMLRRDGEEVMITHIWSDDITYKYVSCRYDRYDSKGKTIGDNSFLAIIGFAVKNKPQEKQMLLSTDAKERKNIPITTGVLDYFPLAVAEVAKCSKAGNDQHNLGQPLHWDKTKSTDHADCLSRHLIDRGSFDTDGIRHSAKLAWRALALLQLELENEQQKGKSE